MGGITGLTPDDIKEMSRGIKTIKEDIMERQRQQRIMISLILISWF